MMRNLIIALVLMGAGILMVTGLLDWMMRLAGVACIISAVVVGFMALRSRK